MTKKLNTHLTQRGILKGSVSPFNNVTPKFIGQHYIEDNNKIYVANGITNTSWVLLHSGEQLMFSLNTYEELASLPLDSISPGAKCYIVTQGIYYRLNSTAHTWEVESNYCYQSEEPTDKSVIWFQPQGSVLQKDNSDVTIEELLANISVLVTQIKGLTKRVSYLENKIENMTIAPTLDNTILLENGDILSLEDGNVFSLE